MFEIYELLSHKLEDVHDRSDVVVAAVTSYAKSPQALTGEHTLSVLVVSGVLMYSPASHGTYSVHTRLAEAVGAVDSNSVSEHGVRLLQLRSETYITDRVKLLSSAIASSSVC
jgi:hypothetical protein